MKRILVCLVGLGLCWAAAGWAQTNAPSAKPGDVLVIDPAGQGGVCLAQSPYSTLVAGVYSTKPGVLGTQHRMDSPELAKEVPRAVVGMVPTKVTAENGPIQVGDLLVTSSTPAYAMRGTDRSRMLGAVVGKALGPLSEGTGVIVVLVTLHCKRGDPRTPASQKLNLRDN